MVNEQLRVSSKAINEWNETEYSAGNAHFAPVRRRPVRPTAEGLHMRLHPARTGLHHSRSSGGGHQRGHRTGQTVAGRGQRIRAVPYE